MNPGLANAFTVSDTTKLGAGAAGAVLNLSTDATNGVAKDTELTYNGIAVKSSSTTVDEAIPGLSLNILKTGSTSVTVSDDNSSLRGKIKAAVSAFNSFNDFFGAQTKLDTTGSGRPPLASDPLLRSANRQLRSFFLNSHVNSGSLDELMDLGITLDRQGKLQIDDAKLDSMLSSKRADVAAFFSGDSGFAKKITDAIDGYTKAGGAIDSVEDRIKRNIAKYTSKIQDLEFRLATREEQLTAEFAAADRAISQLNSQSSSLAGLGSQFRLF
jgi:flagellar hook-associated protein 2